MIMSLVILATMVNIILFNIIMRLYYNYLQNKTGVIDWIEANICEENNKSRSEYNHKENKDFIISALNVVYIIGTVILYYNISDLLYTETESYFRIIILGWIMGSFILPVIFSGFNFSFIILKGIFVTIPVLVENKMFKKDKEVS